MRARGAEGFRFVRGFKMALAAQGGEAGASMVIHDGEAAAQDLITRYLHEIYEVALREIGKSRFDADDVRWCLTVPAIWDDYQKQVMRNAAYDAGFPSEEGRLLLALEPEAAAHYARVSGVNTVGPDGGTGPSLVAADARFVVADCGGGTVDLTAYRSEANDGMAEIGRVSGDTTGSYYLNHAFEQRVLVPRLGGQQEYARLGAASPAALEELIDGWERAKLNITVGREEPVYLVLPLPLFRHLSDETVAQLPALQEDNIDDRIVVSGAEIRDIFEEVVPTLLDLVDRQLDDMRRQVGPADGKELVLLVGGFAKSPYLQERLATHLADRATVLLAPDPARAILAGAVHFAYDPKTRSRRSKHTYGQAMALPFDENHDDRADLITDWLGDACCARRMEVLVRADDSVATDEVVSCDGPPIKSDQTAIKIRLFRSRDREPRYIDDPGCEEIGTMTVDLSEVMHLDIEKRGVRTELRFGESEIRASAILLGTRTRQQVTLQFRAQ
jgi:hypothetical protein